MADFQLLSNVFGGRYGKNPDTKQERKSIQSEALRVCLMGLRALILELDFFDAQKS